MGDPKFVKNLRAQNLTKIEFINEIYAKIKTASYLLNSTKTYADNNNEIGDINDHNTSQISIIDSDGNAVSLTSSINNMLVFILNLTLKNGVITTQKRRYFLFCK